MKNVSYYTLADLRNLDSDRFDEELKSCFLEACGSFSKENLIQAFCGKTSDIAKFKKAA